MKRLLTIFGAPAAGHGREQTYAITQTIDPDTGRVWVASQGAGVVSTLEPATK